MANIRRYAADLARDLGAAEHEDPVESVLSFATSVIARHHQSIACTKLSTLVDWVANKLAIRFEVVETNEDLARLRREYASQGEYGMARLAAELESDNCYGGTFALLQPTKGICYIAVIDCRGNKGHRSYFTKCHEIAHIIVMTDQQLLVFRRTHEEENHPLEDLVDRVASRLGFYRPLLQPYFIGEPSFELIQSIISDLCPEASWESTVRGVISAWPRPATWLRAGLGLKRAEEAAAAQDRFTFKPDPKRKLRISDPPAVSEVASPKFSFHQNMRIPERSIITAVFRGAPAADATEDLSWWDVSGRHLPQLPIKVTARRVAPEIVEAIIVAA
ncbi:MAG: hypothetical protein ACREQV_14680 [Candidatus Binatia bacterium]